MIRPFHGTSTLLLAIGLPVMVAACTSAVSQTATHRKGTADNTDGSATPGKPKEEPVLMFSFDGTSTLRAHIRKNVASGAALAYGIFEVNAAEDRAVDCSSLTKVDPRSATAVDIPIETSSLAGKLDGMTRTNVQGCLTDAQGKVIAQVSTSLMNAWDADGTVVAASPRIFHGVQAYSDACEAELGENPMFAGGKDFDCVADPGMHLIPITATDASGRVTSINSEWPLSAEQQAAAQRCDRPAWLDYNGGLPCAPFTRMGRYTNDKGTRFVAICRRAAVADPNDSGFDVIGVIGHNPESGKTCWYNNRFDNMTSDGRHIPPPNTPTADRFWMDSGGISDQGCPQCHDSDPWAHSPWVDQAIDAQGHTIVPMIGQDSAYTAATKYSLFARESFVRGDARSQANWKQPQHLTNIGACGSCHRIGSAGTMLQWGPRSVGTPEDWQTTWLTDAFRSFARLHWMPTTPVSQAQWASSPDAQSINMIMGCAANPSSCAVADTPH